MTCSTVERVTPSGFDSRVACIVCVTRSQRAGRTPVSPGTSVRRKTMPVPAAAGTSVIETGLPVCRPMPSQRMACAIVRRIAVGTAPALPRRSLMLASTLLILAFEKGRLFPFSEISRLRDSKGDAPQQFTLCYAVLQKGKFYRNFRIKRPSTRAKPAPIPTIPAPCQSVRCSSRKTIPIKRALGGMRKVTSEAFPAPTRANTRK